MTMEVIIFLLILFIIAETFIIIEINHQRVEEHTKYLRKGYDEAVMDIIRRHWYWSRKEHRYVCVDMKPLDGEEIPELKT